MGHSEDGLRGEIHSITYISQEIRKIWIKKNLTLHWKELEKEQQTKCYVSRRKEIIKIRVEINEIESKTMQDNNENKTWFFEKKNKIDKPLTKLIKKKKRENPNK